MDLTRLNPHATELILLTPVPANEWSFFVHSSTRNAAYVHPRLDSLLELCWKFPIVNLGPSFFRSVSTCLFQRRVIEINLSYDVASGSEITPCNKICKPIVVYRFSGNVMTFITTLCT